MFLVRWFIQVTCGMLGHHYRMLSLREAYGPVVVVMRDIDMHELPIVRRCTLCDKRQVLRDTGNGTWTNA